MMCNHRAVSMHVTRPTKMSFSQDDKVSREDVSQWPKKPALRTAILLHHHHPPLHLLLHHAVTLAEFLKSPSLFDNWRHCGIRSFCTFIIVFKLKLL